MGKTIFKRTLATALGFCMVFGQGLVQATAAPVVSAAAVNTAVLDVESILSIPVDKMESEWNTEFEGRLGFVAAGEFAVDANAYLDMIAAQAGRYGELVRAIYAEANDIKGTIDPIADNVLTISGNLDNVGLIIGAKVQEIVDKKMGDLTASEDVNLDALKNIDFSGLDVSGKIELTVNVGDLGNKKVSANCVVTMSDGATYTLTGANSFFDYANVQIKAALASVNVAMDKAFGEIHVLFSEARAELDAAAVKLADAKTTAASYEVKFQDAQAELNAAQADLDAMDDALKGTQEYIDAQAKVDAAQADFNTKLADFNAKKAELADAEAKLAEANATFAEKKAEFEEKAGDAGVQMNNLVADYTQKIAKYEALALDYASRAEGLSKSFNASSTDAVLAKANAYATEQAEKKEIPNAAKGFVNKVLNYDSVASVAGSVQANNALNQLNAFLNERGVNSVINMADIAGALNAMNDVTLSIDGGAVSFKGIMPDDQAAAVAEYYLSQGQIATNITKTVIIEVADVASITGNNQATVYFNVIRDLELEEIVTTTTTLDTTVAPDETTVAPDETTVAPDETTVAPDETTVAPDETTVAPDETTVAPDETTVAPDETTVAPDETTVAPDETTVAPDETTAAPDETTAAPDETTAAPDETTVAPDETTAAPDETTAAPDETTAAPDETTAAPDETTAAPEETTTAIDVAFEVAYTQPVRNMYWSEDTTDFDLTGFNMIIGMQISILYDDATLNTVIPFEITYAQLEAMGALTWSANCAAEVTEYDEWGYYDINVSVDAAVLIEAASSFISVDPTTIAAINAKFNSVYAAANPHFEALLGLRGDANLDNVVDASDSTEVAAFAGLQAVQKDYDQMNDFARFLANVDASELLDATDATYIAVYAGIVALGEVPQFNDIV